MDTGVAAYLTDLKCSAVMLITEDLRGTSILILGWAES